jgi:hypothetical protein
MDTLTTYIAFYRKGEWKCYANKGRTDVIIPDWATHMQYGQGFITFKGDDRVETTGTGETTAWDGHTLIPKPQTGVLRPGTWDETIERSYLIEREGK